MKNIEYLYMRQPYDTERDKLFSFFHVIADSGYNETRSEAEDFLYPKDTSVIIRVTKGIMQLKLINNEIVTVSEGEILYIPRTSILSFRSCVSSLIYHLYNFRTVTKLQIPEGKPFALPYTEYEDRCVMTFLENKINESPQSDKWLQYTFLSLLYSFPYRYSSCEDNEKNREQKLIENITKDILTLSVADIGKKYGISERTVRNLFRKYYRISPKKYQKGIIMKRATALLTEDNMSICEIATELKYSDQFVFSRDFKAFFGVSPQKFRKK